MHQPSTWSQCINLNRTARGGLLPHSIEFPAALLVPFATQLAERFSTAQLPDGRKPFENWFFFHCVKGTKLRTIRTRSLYPLESQTQFQQSFPFLEHTIWRNNIRTRLRDLQASGASAATIDKAKRNWYVDIGFQFGIEDFATLPKRQQLVESLHTLLEISQSRHLARLVVMQRTKLAMQRATVDCRQCRRTGDGYTMCANGMAIYFIPRS